MLTRKQKLALWTIIIILAIIFSIPVIGKFIIHILSVIFFGLIGIALAIWALHELIEVNILKFLAIALVLTIYAKAITNLLHIIF